MEKRYFIFIQLRPLWVGQVRQQLVTMEIAINQSIRVDSALEVTTASHV